MVRINNIMSTTIDINTIKASNSLKSLDSAIRATTNAWKANEARAKSVSNGLEASKSRFEGLAKNIENVKSKIEYLTEQQSKLDRTTKQGQEEYNKYVNKLASAEKQLVSMTAQQNRARKSMDYQKSGLAELQASYRMINKLGQTQVERLKAEGKGYESAKAKLSGYKTSLENLNKQQKIQERELSRIASESGKSSEAYKRQQVRVNETATSIAKLNTKVKSTQSEVNKLNPHGFNKLANGAKHVTNAADKMKSGLKGAWEHVKTGATAAAAGIGAVGAAALSGAKKARDLEQTYKEITNLAVTGGEKQKEATKAVTEMQRQGRDMSIKYGKSQQSIAEAYEELIKRGYTTKQALGAMRTELQGSVASGDDFKDVVSVSSTVLESFGMRAKSTAAMTANTKRAVNELAYAADMTSTGFKDLGYGMSYVGSSAHQAGFSLSETASAMGILSNNGLEASKAGTGLNQVINRLSDATGKLVKGDKKNVLAKLGITPKEVTDSKGQLKSMGTVFGVLEKHMKGMTKVQKINIMKSLFGVNGEQAGLILAKYNKELDTLSGKVLKAGKNGKYVSDLAAKNSQTAKMQMARLKQAGDAFTMTLGAKMLPAINEAGNSLVVFLTKSKDGKKLTNDFAKAVEGLATGLANTIKWIAHHRTETKLIAEGLGAAYGVVKLAGFVQWLNKTRLALKGLSIGSKLVGGFKHLGSAAKTAGSLIKYFGKGVAFAGKTLGKGFAKQVGLVGKAVKGLGKGILTAANWAGKEALSAGKFLGEQISKGFKASANFGKGLFGKGNGAGKLNGLLQSAHSAGGFKNLSTAGKVGTAAAGVGVAIDSATSIVKGIKDKLGSRKQFEDIGAGAGSAIGGGIGLWFGGPAGAAIGSQIGKVIGKWAGDGAKNFQKGWNAKKPPKKFWSLENLGWSAHSMWNGFTKSVGKTLKWFKKNWKEISVYFVSPIAGAINSLYKHNKKFHKWVDGLVKGFKKSWKGVTKWFSKLGKNIQKSWKGMTKWFKNLGKNMAKGLKSSWKSMTKWFSNISKGIKKAWRSMTSWFSKLGKGMSKGLKATWHNITKWFANIGKGIKKSWSSMTSFFTKLGENTAKFFKNPWKSITGWFKGIISGIKNAWDGFWDHISGPIKTLQKLFTGKLKVGSLHLANGTDWRKKYGTPAIVNDAAGKNYREGLIDTDGTVIPFPAKRNLKWWLMPGQEVINGNDMAKMFGHAVHYADGTVHLSKDHKYSKKNYELAKKRAVEDKKELDKLGDKISNALKRKDGNEARRLTKEFNKLTKKYSADKKASKKPDPHAGKVLVDQGLLIGAKSRIGHSVYISKSLFNKLIADLNKKKTTHKKTPRKRTTTRRRTTRRRSTSTRRSYRVSTPKISGGSAVVKASVSGLSSINSLAKAIKSVTGKHTATIKVSYSGTYKAKKSIERLLDALGKLKKTKSASFSVKYSGTYKAKKSVNRLIKSVRSLRKIKTIKVKVKYSGTYKAKKSIDRLIKSLKSLNKNAKKSKFGKLISKQAVEAVKSLKGKGNFAKQFEKMTKKFDKDLKTMTKNSKKEFQDMWSKIKKTSTSGETRLTHQLSSFSTKYKHGWSSLESGVHRAFSHFWTNMKNAAGKGVNSVIKVLNSAISKIDSVISDFGGSKTAVHKSGYVHYAGGSDANGRLTSDTLAIVNDASVGPRQEAIVTDKNDIILPHGDNRPMFLRKGWGVLNGTQTRQLGLPHFANGTGLKHLYELAKRNWSHPDKTGSAMFSAINGLTGAMKDLASGMRGQSKNQGVTWWSQLWKMVDDRVNGEGGNLTGLAKHMAKYGHDKPYIWGGESLKGFDCSGLVQYTLAHDYGINLKGRTVGDFWEQVEHIPKSKAKPGDLVFWLPNHHIGAYLGHNQYYSAQSPDSHPNIGVNTLSSVVGEGSPHFGRIRGLSDKDTNSKNVKANTSLQKLIKRQVWNSGFTKTIDEIRDKYGDAGLTNISGSAKAWTSYIKRAAEKMHTHVTSTDIAKIVSMIAGESGGNATVTQKVWDINMANGNPAQGLLQFIPQTFKAFALPGHQKIKNGYDQLLALFNDSNWKNDIHYGGGWGPTGHRRYANGGIVSSPQLAMIGEGRGPETVIPWDISKRSRAYQLMDATLAQFKKEDGQLENRSDRKNDEEEHDFRKAVLLLLQQLVHQTSDDKKKEEHDFMTVVLTLLTQLVNKSNVANIKLTTPNGRTLWEVIEPFSKAEERRAMTRLRRGLSGR